METIPVAILGSGNIGTDLLYKLKRSRFLKPTVMAGIIPDSEGLARACNEGLTTTAEGIEGLLGHANLFDIVFEETTASAHVRHAPLLKKAGKIAIDLTPAAVGPYVVPLVNLNAHLGEPNVNLVSCGGQATVPFVHAMREVAPVDYAEIVATIASKSAGPGTRQNIDEFTYTTARGLEKIGGALRGKAIIVLNPAEPAVLMRNTIYGLIDNCDAEKIRNSVETMVRRVKEYVQGFRLVAKPLVEDVPNGKQRKKVTLFVEVEGAGDYLPKYAGNLDIMTASAVKVGEEIVRPIMQKPVRIGKTSLTMGYAGVYSSFLLHADKAAQQFGVDARDILVEIGKRKAVGGQEDMIVEVAMALAEKRKQHAGS